LKIACLLPPACETAILNIYGNDGRTIETVNARQLNGIIEINTNKWKAGMYVLELVADNIKIGTASVSIVH